MESLVVLLSVDNPDWIATKQLLESNTVWIQTKFPYDGSYILHLACSVGAPSRFVEYLLNEYKQAVQEKNYVGRYPLHVACQAYYQSEKVLQLFIHHYPQALREKDSYGLSPLHLACVEYQSQSFIELLIKSYPEGAQLKDNKGRLPLHFAIYHRRLLWVIQKLIGVYPRGLVEKDKNGFCPLHLALLQNDSGSDKLIHYLIETCPEAISVKSNSGLFPLHLALKRQKSETFIQSLLSKYPRVVEEKDDRARYPLHYACLNCNAYEAVIHSLITLYPEAVESKDIYGYYPLNYATCHNTSFSGSVIETLFTHYPKAGEQRDMDGCYILHKALDLKQPAYFIHLLVTRIPNTIGFQSTNGDYPLHYACRYELPIETVMQPLINHFPKAIELQGQDGYYPLYNACRNKLPESVIRQLFHHYPEAIKLIDVDECYPLHYVCRNNLLTEGLIQDFITYYPEALQRRSIDGSYPLHYACYHHLQESIIHLLFKLYQNAATEANVQGCYPLHLICQTDYSDTLIQSIFIAYPEAFKQKDIYGCYPIFYACEKNQPVSVIQLLNGKEPLSTNQLISVGLQYPLHDACIRNESYSVVRELIQAYPIKVQQKCTEGMYPLHCACKNSGHESVIRLLYDEFPQASKLLCTNGYTLLHWLCVNENISLDCFITSSLGDTIFSLSVDTRQCGGCTPLHLACKYSKSKQVIEFLLSKDNNAEQLQDRYRYRRWDMMDMTANGRRDVDMAAIGTRDVNGYLPLHMACENNQTDDVIELLIEKYPEAVWIASHDGFLPLHIACAYGQSLFVIRLLISYNRRGLFQRTSDGQDPLQVAEEAGASEEIIHLLNKEIRKSRQSEETDSSEEFVRLPHQEIGQPMQGEESDASEYRAHLLQQENAHSVPSLVEAEATEDIRRFQQGPDLVRLPHQGSGHERRLVEEADTSEDGRHSLQQGNPDEMLWSLLNEAPEDIRRLILRLLNQERRHGWQLEVDMLFVRESVEVLESVNASSYERRSSDSSGVDWLTGDVTYIRDEIQWEEAVASDDMDMTDGPEDFIRFQPEGLRYERSGHEWQMSEEAAALDDGRHLLEQEISYLVQWSESTEASEDIRRLIQRLLRLDRILAEDADRDSVSQLAEEVDGSDFRTHLLQQDNSYRGPWSVEAEAPEDIEQFQEVPEIVTRPHEIVTTPIDGEARPRKSWKRRLASVMRTIFRKPSTR